MSDYFFNFASNIGIEHLFNLIKKSNDRVVTYITFNISFQDLSVSGLLFSKTSQRNSTRQRASPS